MFRFEELEVWKLAVSYGKDCYVVAKKFPQEENFAFEVKYITLADKNRLYEEAEKIIRKLRSFSKTLSD